VTLWCIDSSRNICDQTASALRGQGRPAASMPVWVAGSLFPAQLDDPESLEHWAVVVAE